MRQAVPLLPRSSRIVLKRTLEERVLTELARELAGPDPTTRVADGPFAGQILPNKPDRLTVPQLLGTYEQELHPTLRQLHAVDFQTIVDIGCGDGYYAVGMAQMFPAARVIGVDIAARARNRSHERIRLNGMDSRMMLFASADQALQHEQFLDAHDRHLYLFDCEGAEHDLLLQRPASTFANADLIVECHEFLVPGVTEALQSHFVRTHASSVVHQGGRNPNAIDALAGYPEATRWLATCEFRPVPMHWLVRRAYP